MIENDNQRVLTWEIGARAKTVYNWEKIFRSGIKSIEQRKEEALTDSEVSRVRMHCKSQLDNLSAEKLKDREEDKVFNVRHFAKMNSLRKISSSWFNEKLPTFEDSD